MLITKNDCLQCRWKLRGDNNDKGHTTLYGKGGVETSSYLQIVLRNQRGVLSFRRANMFHEIRIVDVRRIHGEKPLANNAAFSAT